MRSLTPGAIMEVCSDDLLHPEVLTMFPLIIRFAALILAGHLFDRIVKHPRLAPIVNTGKGRLLLLVLGFGLRRRLGTRYLRRAVSLAGHRLRRLPAP
jgi:hypothetical protein